MTDKTPAEQHKRVLDPEEDAAAFKALTHPLRIRLLGMLRKDGPATASELAALTGESSASTSYHLRVLAKYAFVEEAEHRDGRERRWQSVHSITSWSNEGMGTTRQGRAFLDFVRRQQVGILDQILGQHEEDLAAGRLGPEWVEPSGIGDMMQRLTPESLGELRQVVEAKVAELGARDEKDPRAEQVIVYVAGLPLASRNSASAKGTSKASDGES
ncbi:helix-turn-helix domain-containing protein [Streptomyces sp. NPDC048442]|uniref:ArsR/SmtB family transcription factor n=1 Tax=Streptomyces sp. NPDC048442 TaxID=3154823 RepID=UPI0034382811